MLNFSGSVKTEGMSYIIVVWMGFKTCFILPVNRDTQRGLKTVNHFFNVANLQAGGKKCSSMGVCENLVEKFSPGIVIR